MVDYNYENLINSLDWKYPEHMQNIAVEHITNMDIDISKLFDIKRKSTWDNYTKIVQKLDYPKNSLAIPSLFTLLEDLNWPGANRAVQILSGIDKRVLIPFIEVSLDTACINKDSLWIEGINVLIRTAKIKKKDFIDPKKYNIL